MAPFPPTPGDATGSNAAVLKVDGHQVEHEIEEPIEGATISNITGLGVEWEYDENWADDLQEATTTVEWDYDENWADDLQDDEAP